MKRYLLPHKVWKTRCVPDRCLCTEETTNVKLPRCVKALYARSKNHQCKTTGARKGIAHTRQKPPAQHHRTGNLPPDSYGTNLSSPRAFPIPGGVKKMMRAADRLPCRGLCALRIIFKPPFRFMPRVRCVGVRADQKPGRARSEAEDQRGRVSARTEQRRLFRRFWPVKSGKTAAPGKAQTPPRPAPVRKPGRVKGPRTSEVKVKSEK